jgi:chorismate mutase
MRWVSIRRRWKLMRDVAQAKAYRKGKPSPQMLEDHTVRAPSRPLPHDEDRLPTRAVRRQIRDEFARRLGYID